jgi:hypothetical protein
MSTFAQVKSRIADDLNRTDLDTQIGVAINRAIRYYYNRFRFYFNQTSTTFSTVANQFAYGTSDGIPAYVKEIDFLSVQLSSQSIQELTPRTFEWIQQMNTGNLTGTPTDYAYYQEKIYLYPVPNTVFTMNLFYTKSYADLSSASDTNDFTEEAEDLIEARAEWWLYSRIIKDYDAAATAKQEESDALIQLVTETTRITSSKQVRPTNF